MARRPLLTELGVRAALRLVAWSFSYRPSLRRWLRWVDGWIDFTIGLRTESGSVAGALRFHGGRVRALAAIPADADAVFVYRDEAVLRETASMPASDVLLALMRGRLRTEGNPGYLSLFNFYLSLLRRRAPAVAPPRRPTVRAPARGSARLAAAPAGALDDPYLSRYSLADFPRLGRFLDDHFETVPELCPERPLLLTRFFREHGFERRADGRRWNPVLRQALAFKQLMERRRPILRPDDLLAGTTTSKDVGVVIYPDAHGALIWGELLTVGDRALNPYRVAPETVRLLHHEVFPFWLRRTFKEWVRDRHGAPLCQQLDERFAVYFLWKQVALSHTIPDFPRLLRLGARAMIAELAAEAATAKPARRDTLAAMRLGLEGLVAYARNLAAQARRDGREDVAAICERVPAEPARTLHEALQAIWIAWIGLHMENTNAGLSLGRLDQWLQPYFAADVARLGGDGAAREAYVRRAIELTGCFYLRCADHLPLVPDIGNYLFGGSSSDQAITLGGVTRDGADAVNDMTWVLLKVTELLKLRDPNVNARYSAARNGDAYLKRLCEVNLVTAATPSIHGDENVLRSLAHLGYAAEDARDWSATGCVEPTISGRHMGHTGSLMLNLVAPLEMALDDGRHPLMRWKVGPATGAADGFVDFEACFAAYERQLDFLVEQATAYNHMLGEAHATLRPTPLLSALLDGPLASGRDVTAGGATYNTSGVACIGLADVVDSLLAIERIVYRDRRASWPELRAALAADFVGHEKLLARIERGVPRFGSGDPAAVAMANRVARRVHDAFAARKNFRGGPYTTGFWSMSNHVAFGGLTGALPSGRRAGKPFTPGLTPSPGASKTLLDNLRDVAALEPRNLDNNIAFNIKYVPAADDGHAAAVDHLRAYVKTYVELGGMQIQLNVVSSETLRDAMAHPERYRDLLVRISGYNAYFVTLNRDMQLELIERSEFRG